MASSPPAAPPPPLAPHPATPIATAAQREREPLRAELFGIEHLEAHAQTLAAPLTVGELWAVPIMRRLGLLENLRRLSCQVLSAWDDRCEADAWVEHLLTAAERTLEEADTFLLHPSRRPRCDWSDPFVVHL